jgi:hypothetical protein
MLSQAHNIFSMAYVIPKDGLGLSHFRLWNSAGDKAVANHKALVHGCKQFASRIGGLGDA